MEYLPLLLGVVMGVITSYTDIRTGFIDDIHVFPTLALIGKLRGWENEEPGCVLDRIPVPVVEGGIAYYLYLGLSSGNLMLALSGLLGFLLGFGLGWLLYYLGGWANGDAIILAGFSALLPYAPASARVVPPYTVDYPLYSVTIFLNSLMAVFPFIFMYALGIILVRKKFAELRGIFLEGVRLTFEVALWIMAALGFRLLIYEFLGLSITGLWSWIFTIAVIYALGKFRKVGDAIGIVVVAYLIYQEPATALQAFLKLLVVLYLFKVFLAIVKFMGREALMEEVTVEDLREWDILGETIFIDGDTVGRDRDDLLTRIKRAVSAGDPSLLRPKHERVVASPNADGLKKEQIEELKRLVEEGMLENRFLRKKSMPFAPALFIGFLISYFWGDIFWWIQLKIAGL